MKARRGAKLDSRETALFSGEYWTGQRGRELGLVDALGDLRNVLRERYGDKVRTPLIAERGLFGRRVPGVSRGSSNCGTARASPTTWLRRSRRAHYGRVTDCRRS